MEIYRRCKVWVVGKWSEIYRDVHALYTIAWLWVHFGNNQEMWRWVADRARDKKRAG